MTTKSAWVKFGLLLIFSMVFSRETLYAQYAFGLKGGINFCNYGGVYLTSNYQNKTTIPFGFVAHFQTSKWFSVQAELNYDPKGANYSIVKTSQSFYSEEYKDFEENLNYLTLPVLAKFDIGSKNRIFGYTGVYLSYLLSANINGTYIITNNFDPADQIINPIDRDYKSEIDNFDVGAVFGLGADYSISEKIAAFIDGRFNWGWANVAQQGQGNIFNHTWSVNLGLVYRIKSSGTTRL